LIKTKVDFIKELRRTKSIVEQDQLTAFYCNVLIKDKKFKIFCGEGKQTLRWLTDVAIFKYKAYSANSCGIACYIKLEDGNVCDLEEQICKTLQNNENVWILFKEEYEVYLEEMNKKYLPFVPLVNQTNKEKMPSNMTSNKTLKNIPFMNYKEQSI
jgi:hypothetical protein